MWYEINCKLPYLNDQDYLDTIKFKLQSMFDDYEIDMSLVDYDRIEVFTKNSNAIQLLQDLFCTQRVEQCRFRGMRGKSDYLPNDGEFKKFG